MYDSAHPASLDARDVIAAWLVGLAVELAVFVYRGFFPEPGRRAQAALRNGAPAVSLTVLCAVRNEHAAALRG